MTDTTKKCYHHPKRDAVAIINLGTSIDLDTPVCEKCLNLVGKDKVVRWLHPEEEPMTDQTPTQICDAYRAQLRRLYGDESADESYVDYSGGWFYINVAKRFPDGSVGKLSPTRAYRKQKVLQMIARLEEREPTQ